MSLMTNKSGGRRQKAEGRRLKAEIKDIFHLSFFISHFSMEVTTAKAPRPAEFAMETKRL